MIRHQRTNGRLTLLGIDFKLMSNRLYFSLLHVDWAFLLVNRISIGPVNSGVIRDKDILNQLEEQSVNVARPLTVVHFHIYLYRLSVITDVP